MPLTLLFDTVMVLAWVRYAVSLTDHGLLELRRVVVCRAAPAAVHVECDVKACVGMYTPLHDCFFRVCGTPV